MHEAYYFEFFPFIGELLRQFSMSGFRAVSASARTVEESASHGTSLVPNGRNEALRCTTVPRCACASPATADCNAWSASYRALVQTVFSLATFTVGGTMFDMNQCLQGVTRTRSISLSQ